MTIYINTLLIIQSLYMIIKETIMNENYKIPKYFYLDDKMFAIYDTEFHLDLIDITNEKKIIRKININWIEGNQTNSNIKIYIILIQMEKNIYVFLLGNKK